MPFHLTVEIDSKSVTDWHIHPGEGSYVTTINPEKLANVRTVEEAFGQAAAECIGMALSKDLPKSEFDTLLQPSEMREDIDAIRLYTALSVVGLNAVCKEWIGELPKH